MKNKYAEYSDNELLELLMQGRGQAKKSMEELYRRYSNKIYTYCTKYLYDEKIALDIFHDSFINFYDAVKKGVQVKNVGAFITQIARNLCLNENVKKVNQGLEFKEGWISGDINESYDKKETSEILDKALMQLPDDYREIIILKEFLDMKYIEIAETLDIGLSLVRTRIYRAKQMLRDYLKVYIDEIKSN